MRVLVMAALMMSGAAGAQEADAPQRIRSVNLQPGETCPPSTSAEVVVCYQGGNPYRIPPALRRTEIPAANQSWVNRAAAMDETGRVAGGLPDTCSPVGTGGQSGCFQARARAYAAEKRAEQRAAESVPGGE